MKTIFNLVVIVGLTLGAIFIYGAFKNSQLIENNSLKNTEESEVIKGTIKGKDIIDGWNNYRNEEYNFSIQYPESWEVQESLKPQNQKALQEIDLHQKEYDMTRAYLTIQIFDNQEKLSVSDWWNNWLDSEDKKEADCQAEYKGEAPCLFLRGMVEKESDSTLYDLSMKTIQLFQFDSSKECNYIVRNKYIYGICYDGINPNDSNFETNRKTTSKIFDTFIFNNLIKKETIVEESTGNKGFEQYVSGNWKSVIDSKSLLVLEEGGTIKNIYDGKKINSGTWVIDGYKLRSTINGEEYEYTVVFAGSERLELNYLPRGNTLHFVRVTE